MPIASVATRQIGYAFQRTLTGQANAELGHFLENPANAALKDRAFLGYARGMTRLERWPAFATFMRRVWQVMSRRTLRETGDPALGNMGRLSPTVYRGMQPTRQGLAQLKAAGIDTVINLRTETNWEQPVERQLGIKNVHVPLEAGVFLRNEQMLNFLSAATDPAHGNVMFHCLYGKDRTGAMAAIYRIAAQGWSADRAVAEMFKYRFTPGVEDAMVVSVRDFARYWQGLDRATRDRVLHR